MAKATILIIERASKDRPGFSLWLERKDYRVFSVNSGTNAVKIARKEKPDLLILDAASLGTSGDRIISGLREKLNGIPMIHVRGEAHAVGDEREGEAEINLDLPFTARKLANRVSRLLPVEQEEMLVSGPVRYYVKKRVVRSYGRERRLTPKLAGLLELFMRFPDEALDRGYLMQKVWKTDYVGDTRTLDVHIRWLRQAIERRPTRPQHILTVRGTGYRFVPEPESADKR